MIKINKLLISCFYWIQVFAAPFLIFGIIALIIYSNYYKNEPLAYILLGVGVIIGIIFAEFVRKKYGYDVFFSKVFGSADIDEKIRSRA